MDQLTLLPFTFLLMLLFQIWHIFEEIGQKAYVVGGTLKFYLRAASAIVGVHFGMYTLILLELRIGYWAGLLGAFFAIGNGFIHLVGYIKTKTYYESLGAGVFTGIPLGIVGGIVLWQLIRVLDF